MPKKLLFIGGPILLVILLVAVTFIFDIFGVKSALFGSGQAGNEVVDLGTVAQAQQKSLNQYDKFPARNYQIGTRNTKGRTRATRNPASLV